MLLQGKVLDENHRDIVVHADFPVIHGIRSEETHDVEEVLWESVTLIPDKEVDENTLVCDDGTEIEIDE